MEMEKINHPLVGIDGAYHGHKAYLDKSGFVYLATEEGDTKEDGSASLLRVAIHGDVLVRKGELNREYAYIPVVCDKTGIASTIKTTRMTLNAILMHMSIATLNVDVQPN